jgi:Ni,Fe-hydrogenase III component G
VQIPGLTLALDRLPAPLPIWRGSVDADAWQVAARAVAASDGRLVALWGADGSWRESGGLSVCCAYALADGLVWLEHPLPVDAPSYPDLAPFFPCAVRMQRAAADLLGIVAAGARDTRPWLDHGAWPPDTFPSHAQTAAVTGLPGREVVDYPFVRVGGDGVHEIPVGPVHAGIIEPGHFRFTANGETVVRLEERLGYVHKGVEGLLGKGIQVNGLRGTQRLQDGIEPLPRPLQQAAEPMDGDPVRGWTQTVVGGLELLLEDLRVQEPGELLLLVQPAAQGRAHGRVACGGMTAMGRLPI